MENQKHTNHTTNMETLTILKHQQVRNRGKLKGKVQNQRAKNQERQTQDLLMKLEHTVEMESRIWMTLITV